MRKVKEKQELSILEAVDCLLSLSEIDVTLSSKTSPQQEQSSLHAYRWFDQALLDVNQGMIIQAFVTVHHYFQDLCENHVEQLKDKHVVKGLQALLSILDEAVEKIEKFTELFKEDPALDTLMELSEYKSLQDYISAFVLPHFEDSEAYWEDQLGIHEEDLVGIVKKGVRDVEDVREDKLYDLFYIKKEDKKPFYDYDMIRRLKHLYDFDQLMELSDEENSFIRIRQLQDKDFHQKAASILEGSSHLIGTFYKDFMKMKGIPWIAAMNKSLMALMLAANPRSWHDTTSTAESRLYKSSAEYFGDFHYYLREALHSPEYKKAAVAKADQGQGAFHSCFLLMHKLCSAYFLTVSLQKEMVALIRRMIHTGSKLAKGKEPSHVDAGPWKDLLWEDDSIRQVLQKQPNGPIRRIVESFLRGDIGGGWDPLSHKNTPIQLFTLVSKEKELTILRMPAPVMQKSIQTADVTPEFEAFLKGCVLGERHYKFLLINLQNRTSWEEHARSESLENFAKKEEMKRTLSVIGLPKQTDFYFQKESYADLDEASLFLGQIVEQFEGREQCGFYWPDMYFDESLAFAKIAVSTIHKLFFEEKKHLSQKERQNFIEIFYFLLLLKAIDLFNPQYMALSCKDSIDTGSAATGGFFSCLRSLLSDKPWKEEEKDLLLWILYAPALFFRERAIQKETLTRLINAMLCFEEGIVKNRAAFLKEYKKLYKEELWDEIEIKKAG